MKIKFFSAFLACAFLSVVGVSTVGCASDKNNSGSQAIVEYSKPVHVSRSVKVSVSMLLLQMRKPEQELLSHILQIPLVSKAVL